MEDIISLVIWIGIIALVGGRFKKKIMDTPQKPGSRESSKGNAQRRSTSSMSSYKSGSSSMDNSRRESSAMPHKHRESGVYDSYNKKSWRNDSGTMPHKHETGHYTAMLDVSKLPPGYILLNGEPVRVADLEGK